MCIILFTHCIQFEWRASEQIHMKFFKQVEIWKIWQLNNFVYLFRKKQPLQYTSCQNREKICPRNVFSTSPFGPKSKHWKLKTIFKTNESINSNIKSKHRKSTIKALHSICPKFVTLHDLQLHHHSVIFDITLYSTLSYFVLAEVCFMTFLVLQIRICCF